MYTGSYGSASTPRARKRLSFPYHEDANWHRRFCFEKRKKTTNNLHNIPLQRKRSKMASVFLWRPITCAKDRSRRGIALLWERILLKYLRTLSKVRRKWWKIESIRATKRYVFERATSRLTAVGAKLFSSGAGSTVVSDVMTNFFFPVLNL